LVETNPEDATLTDCHIYGISAWGVKLSEGTIQRGLIVTPAGEPAVTIDDLEVAQFVYLLLHNEKIRRVIDTVGKKGVLLLGRFTEGRIAVLERLRDELRKPGYLPIVFSFEKLETKTFTETVRVLGPRIFKPGQEDAIRARAALLTDWRAHSTTAGGRDPDCVS
jgi:hypothetical protein